MKQTFKLTKVPLYRFGLKHLVTNPIEYYKLLNTIFTEKQYTH